MTISANVRKELFEMTNSEGKLIRIKPTEAKAGTTVYSSKQSQPLKMWTQEEHEKFLEAMEKYPAGPWKVIASFIGTKTTRQTMTHAQKYRQKISRWRRGLRHKGRKQASDDGAQHSEHEYSAKENLFKAIEYVSGDEMVAGRAFGATQAVVSPTRSLTGVPGHEAPRSELFRLAELASYEVMKQEPVAVPTLPSLPSSPPDVEMADMSSPVTIKQCPEEIVARASVEFSDKLRKMEWGNNQAGFRPSPEWCMQRTEVRLSPLRASPDGSPFPARKFGGVLSAITEMSYQNAQNRLPLPLPSTPLHGMLSPMRVAGAEERKMQQQQYSAFRLPPLNVASGQPPNVYSIPPLRSKIDPSVLSGRAYYASTN
jgi:SHAQKYF class myb-like DNA-binding protein